MLSIAAYLCGCIAFWALRRPPVFTPQSQSAGAPAPRI
jgi:hypothetical protein